MRFAPFQFWQWLSSGGWFGQQPDRSTHLEMAQTMVGLGSWQIKNLGSSQETLDWSNPLYGLLGLVPAEVVPSPARYLAHVHPDDRDRVRQAHATWRTPQNLVTPNLVAQNLTQHLVTQHLVAQNKLVAQNLEAIEYRLLSQDGRERWVREQVSVEWSEQGDGVHLTGVVQDITSERQQADYHRLIAETSQRIRQSLQVDEILQTAVAEVRRLLGVDRVFIAQVNSQGCGYIAAESNDAMWGSIATEEFPVEVITELQTVYQQRGTIVHHSPADQPQAGFLHYLYQKYDVQAGISTPISTSGATMGLLSVHQCSRTRQWTAKELQLLEELAAQVGIALHQGYLYRQVQETAIVLEQQVQERTQQLKQQMLSLQILNQQQERLIHAISHDLQTPILGMVMVLQRLAKHPEKPLSRTMLDLMLDSSQRQLSLLKSLQEEAAASSPMLKLDRKPTQMMNVIDRALNDLQPLLANSNTQVITQFEDGLPVVAMDASHIHQVLEHLVTNAVQHNLPGTQITIEVGMDDGRSSMMSQNNRRYSSDREAPGSRYPWQHSPCLYCRVQDSGRGLQPEQIALMFHRPYLRSTHNPHITGLGLGLYLCHQTIKAHGGEIGVTSQAGQGTTVWFTVPIPTCVTSAIDLAS
ncbi:ATP-binding protein [Alkalinema sp. FACHB-956]|uniref:sensor histidine kinase n=1 Tax=Alkalinema sp. FACHB-956 TaxID=2692768 RepID=UPI00168934B6|nr:ATP-binding protein [Alkalinema sp. FACHB-956]MBD2327210.1 GAF domain-containing protein [Alkalinema sp. FACHB-956]